MNEIKFGLYRVDKRYLGCLKQGGKVRDINSDLYCGPVITVESVNRSSNLFVPADSTVTDEFGAGMSALDFDMMIPVPDDLLTEETGQAGLAEFCGKNRDEIVARAEAVHRAACDI